MEVIIVEKRKLISEILKLLFLELDFIKKIVCINIFKNLKKLIKNSENLLIVFNQDTLNNHINELRKIKLKAPDIKLACIFDPNFNTFSLDSFNFINGWLSTEWSLIEFKNAIRYLYYENVTMPKKLAFKIASRVFDESAKVLEKLTEKEKIILKLLCEGKLNKEIADILNLKEKTIKNHIHSIYKKLGVRRKAEAIVKFSNFEFL